MTNEELRLEIAKVKGWHVVNTSTNENGLPDNPLLNWYVDDSGGVHGHVLTTNWPEDIAAAWELVEEMQEDSLVTITCFGSNIVMVYKRGEFRDDNICRAICLAWLALEGAK